MHEACGMRYVFTVDRKLDTRCIGRCEQRGFKQGKG